MLSSLTTNLDVAGDDRKSTEMTIWMDTTSSLKRARRTNSAAQSEVDGTRLQANSPLPSRARSFVPPKFEPSRQRAHEIQRWSVVAGVKMTSTVPTEVRLPADCFHRGPAGQPCGILGAKSGPGWRPELWCILSFSGGARGRVRDEDFSPEKNLKDRKTHLLFRFRIS